jgi:hypothetical protein
MQPRLLRSPATAECYALERGLKRADACVGLLLLGTPNPFSRLIDLSGLHIYATSQATA